PSRFPLPKLRVLRPHPLRSPESAVASVHGDGLALHSRAPRKRPAERRRLQSQRRRVSMNKQQQQQHPTALAPAFHALEQLRGVIDGRIGKPGTGNLHGRVSGYLDVLETTLRQVVPIQAMVQTLNTQAELAVSGFRALSKVAALMPAALSTEPGGSATNDSEAETDDEGTPQASAASAATKGA